MSQTISIEKKNELFENFQKTGFANHRDGFETIKGIAAGDWQRQQLFNLHFSKPDAIVVYPDNPQ